MRKLFFGFVIAVLLAVTVKWVYGMWQKDRERRVIAELALATQLRINDSTVARLTVAHASKDSLGGLLQATRELNGRLLAGVGVHIPARDTVVVHDTIETVVHADGSREARFKDSTFAGIIDAHITAPPTGALGVEYTIHRPAFTPKIGFVQVGDSTVAVVTWQGEEAQVSTPYFARAQRPLLQGFGEATYTWNDAVTLRAGGEIRTPIRQLVAIAGLEQRLVVGAKPGLQLGARIWW